MAKLWSLKNNTSTEYILSEEEKTQKIKDKEMLQIEDIKEEYSKFKEDNMKKFRSLQSDIASGLEEPLTKEEIAWYNLIKIYDPEIGSIFPEPSDRVKNMI